MRSFPTPWTVNRPSLSVFAEFSPVVIGDDLDSGCRLALPVGDDAGDRHLVRERDIAEVDDGVPGSAFFWTKVRTLPGALKEKWASPAGSGGVAKRPSPSALNVHSVPCEEIVWPSWWR